MKDPILWKMLAAAVQRGEFRLASGRTSNFYLDARRVTMTSRGVHWASLAILRKIKAEERTIHAIGGPATAAVPLIGACLAQAGGWGMENLVGFYTLKQAKDHGTGQRVHGPLTPDMTVILIDDVATSGGSLLDAAQAVRELGCVVDTAFCLVDRLEARQRGPVRTGHQAPGTFHHS